MAQMKMLRQVMSPADIYTHADTICDMLRDHYGSYDADSLDEVMVEETFVQRLSAKGYDLLPEGAEVDDRPMAPPPSRREMPRAEIGQLPVRRPGQNGGGGVPLRRREPAGDSDSPLPLRSDGGGLPLRRGQPGTDSELSGRRSQSSGDTERGGPMRRRPLGSDVPGPMRRSGTGEGESSGLSRRRPMASGDAGPVRPRPESSAVPERTPAPRPEISSEAARPVPEAQVAPERVAPPAEQRLSEEQRPVTPQVPEVAAPVERMAESPEPVAQAIEAAPATAEAKPAPKPRARRSTRAKVTPPEANEGQSEA
jgi:hypothetical protein